MQATSQPTKPKNDLFVAAAIFVVTLVVYVRTLAPSVASIFDDTLEIQYIVPRLGILHQTGYPLYALLGKAFTLIVRMNDAAYRLNLFSATTAACAVAVLYLVIRQLTTYRIAAVIAALAFAFSPTFWDQANTAEVYALQVLLSAIILYAALIWGREPITPKFYALAFVMGLGLTHHRLTLLMYPAIAVYVLLLNRNILRDFGALGRAVLLFLAPLLLYLYLPLRAGVGSADGLYQNTPRGFFDWVVATKYIDFLTQDPLLVQHDAAFYAALFTQQFTLFGLALAAIGIVWLVQKSREWVLLIVALITVAAFAFNYRTADVQVHFLTTFLLIAVFAGVGIDALLRIIQQLQSKIPDYVVRFSFTLPHSCCFSSPVTIYELPDPRSIRQVGRA
jgi:hypothetical protein